MSRETISHICEDAIKVAMEGLRSHQTRDLGSVRMVPEPPSSTHLALTFEFKDFIEISYFDTHRIVFHKIHTDIYSNAGVSANLISRNV